jgi:hypothetical protein
MKYIVLALIFFQISCTASNNSNRSIANSEVETAFNDSDRWQNWLKEDIPLRAANNFLSKNSGWKILEKKYKKCDGDVYLGRDYYTQLWMLDTESVDKVRESLNSAVENHIYFDKITKHLKCLTEKYPNDKILNKCGLDKDKLKKSLRPKSPPINHMDLSQANIEREKLLKKAENFQNQFLCVYSDEIIKVNKASEEQLRGYSTDTSDSVE